MDISAKPIAVVQGAESAAIGPSLAENGAGLLPALVAAPLARKV